MISQQLFVIDRFNPICHTQRMVGKHTPQKSAHTSALQNAASNLAAVNLKHFCTFQSTPYTFSSFLNKSCLDAHRFWLLQAQFWNYLYNLPSKAHFWIKKPSGCFASTNTIRCSLENTVLPISTISGQFLLIHTCIGTGKKSTPFLPRSLNYSRGINCNWCSFQQLCCSHHIAVLLGK